MNLEKISQGKKFPEEVKVFIEIAQGSSVKYELDKETGLLYVDRFVHTSMGYPFNYGFVPATHAADGDPLDVMVISSSTIMPGVLISVRPIGVLKMEDESGEDNKIIAVPTSKIDPHYEEIHDIADIDEHTKKKIKHFFESYKQLEPGKWVKTKDFLGKKEALEEIENSLVK
jgi:inorganic pyrophosphatase